MDGTQEAEEQTAWKQKYEVLESEYRSLKQVQAANEEDKDRLKEELASLQLKLNMVEEKPQNEPMATENENEIAEVNSYTKNLVFEII